MFATFGKSGNIPLLKDTIIIPLNNSESSVFRVNRESKKSETFTFRMEHVCIEVHYLQKMF